MKQTLPLIVFSSIWLLPFTSTISQTTKVFHAFYWPTSIAIDSKGNLFISGKNNKIIKITRDGVANDFAGNMKGYTGHKDGIGASAGFDETKGITIDADDNLYLADYKTIRKITPEGLVSTIAGNEKSVQKDGYGILASFRNPKNIAIDNNRNLYVTDEGFDAAKKMSFHVLRKITPGGEVSTLKNNEGNIIQITYAGGLVCDTKGNIIVCDQGSRCIKKITPDGTITTIAGKCDFQKWNPTFKEGSFNTALLVEPSGISLNKAGDIFFSDLRMHRIIKISNGSVTTIAGNSEIDKSHSNIGGYAEEGYADGKAKLALFDGPQGIAFDSEGNLFIVDTNNSCIRKLSTNGMVTTFCK